MRKSRSKPLATQDLDLIPIMNLVTILIPFLLISAQFIHLAVIDTNLPASRPPLEEILSEQEPFRLQVHMEPNRIVFTAMGGDLSADFAGLESDASGPRVEGKDLVVDSSSQGYEWEEFRGAVESIKDKHPEAEDLILIPNDEVRYEEIIQAMDLARGSETQPLFPAVIMGVARV